MGERWVKHGRLFLFIRREGPRLCGGKAVSAALTRSAGVTSEHADTSMHLRINMDASHFQLEYSSRNTLKAVTETTLVALSNGQHVK